MVLRREITSQILALLEENPAGLSVTDIARSVGINRNTAGRYLENLLVSGKVEMHRAGMSKVYLPSERVPVSAVLSISSELVIQLDSFQRIIFVNEPFLKLIGTESRNILGKNIEFTSIVTVFDESWTGFLERIRRGIAGEEWSGEIELRSRGIILFCRIAPTVFDDGRKGVSAFFEDITQWKDAERALRESESRLRLIAENVPDLILMLNKDLAIIYISRTSEHSPDQVCGRSVYDFVPEKFHPAASACFHQVLATGKTAQYGTEYYFRNGETRYYESTVGAVLEDGKVVALVLNAHDITDRKKAEDAVRESEEKFRTLFEGALNPVMMVDSQGRYIEANKAALRFLETGREELLQKTVWDYTPRELVASQKREHTPFIAPRTVETVYCVNGRYKTLILNIIPMDLQAERILIGIGQDITERKQAEKALQESEERYRQLVEISPDAVLIHQEGKIVFVNPAALAMLGETDPRELLGKSLLDMIHPDFREAVRKNIGRDLQGEITPPTEVRMIRAGGTTVTVEGRGVMTIYKGRPAIQVAIRDTTERHRTEERLHESEERYRQLVEISPDAILIHQEGKIVFVNPAALAMFGLENPREIMDKDAFDLIHPDSREKVRENIERDLRGEVTPPIEIEMFRSDGAIITAETRGVKTTYNDKPAIQVAIRDTTERRRSEEKLRESEDKYQFFISRALDGIIVIQDDIIKVCNQRAAGFYGDSVEKIVGRRFIDFIHPDTRADVADRYRRRMAGEKTPPVYETVLKRMDGSRFYAEVNAGIITYDGKAADLIFLRDINDRKKAEEALREGPRGTGISDDLSFLVTGIKPDKSAK
jgi:PAS domain S-box-containing protein